MAELIFMRCKEPAKAAVNLDGSRALYSQNPTLVDIVPDDEGGARCRELFAKHPNADLYEFYIVRGDSYEVSV